LRLVTLEAVSAGSEAAPVEVGRTLDVSEAGIRVETARQLQPAQELDIQIAAGDRLVTARGRVVYSEPTGSLAVTGIAWVTIAPDDLDRLVRAG
jgi:hypothetical protein